MKRALKTHYFKGGKWNAVWCEVNPSKGNWQREDFCTSNRKLVTCGNCLRLAHLRILNPEWVELSDYLR